MATGIIKTDNQDYSLGIRQIGTYNGKPLYRECFTFTVSSTAETNTNINLTYTPKEVFALVGTMRGIPFGYFVNSNEYVRVFTTTTAPNATVQTKGFNGTGYGYIEYTKS